MSSSTLPAAEDFNSDTAAEDVSSHASEDSNSTHTSSMSSCSGLSDSDSDSDSDSNDDDDDDDDDDHEYPVKPATVYHQKIRMLFRESHGIHLDIEDSDIEEKEDEDYNVVIVRKTSTNQVWELYHPFGTRPVDPRYEQTFASIAAGAFFRDEVAERWRCQFPYDFNRILAYDTTCDNALGNTYVIQTHLATPTLHDIWPTLSEHEQLNVFRELGLLLLAYDRLEAPENSIPGKLCASSDMPSKLNMMTTLSVPRPWDFMGPGGHCSHELDEPDRKKRIGHGKFSVPRGTRAKAMLNTVLNVMQKQPDYDRYIELLIDLVEDLQPRTMDYTQYEETLLLQPPDFSLKNIHVFRSAGNDASWKITGVKGWETFSLAPRVYSRHNIDVYCFDPSPRDDGEPFEGCGKSKHCTDLGGGPDDCWYIMQDVHCGWHSNPCRHVDQRYRQRLLLELHALDKDYCDAVLDPVKLMLARAYLCATEISSSCLRPVYALHDDWNQVFNGAEPYLLETRLA